MTAPPCDGLRPFGRGRLSPILVVAVAFAAAGCSAVPDWANPIAWVSDAFSDDAPPIETSAGGVVEQLEPRREQAERKPYPSLKTVPERPANITSPDERRRIVEGLIADRANARYTNPVIPEVEEAPPPREPAGSTPASPGEEEPASRSDRSSSLAPGPAETAAALRSGPRPPAVPPIPVSAKPLPAGPRVQTDMPPTPAWAPGTKLAALSPAGAGAGHGVTAKTRTAVAPPQARPASKPAERPAAAEAPAVPRSGGTILISSRGRTVVAPEEFAPPPLGAPAGIIKFAHGSSRLDDADRALLRRLARQAKSEGAFVRVVGHSSQRTGDMPYSEHRQANFKMSLKRANAVARQLRAEGIGPETLIVEAVGDSRPIYYEIMPTGEAENRRVEIYLEQATRMARQNRP